VRARRNGGREKKLGRVAGSERGQRGNAYAASLYFAGLLQSPIPRRRPSSLASELTPSPSSTSHPCHPPGDPSHPLGGNSTNPGISYGETNESEGEKERNREKEGREWEREREREREGERGRERKKPAKPGAQWFPTSSLFPVWGVALTDFTGMPLIFWRESEVMVMRANRIRMCLGIHSDVISIFNDACGTDRAINAVVSFLVYGTTTKFFTLSHSRLIRAILIFTLLFFY